MVVHIKGLGQCFLGIDVSKAVGCNDDDNARRAVQIHVPGKYRMRLGDTQSMLEREADVALPKENTVLLKEQGLYCFFLCCKWPGTKPFMEWVVETVLPWEVWEWTSVIEEKDAAIALLNHDLQDCDNQIQAIKYENVALQAQGDMYQAELQRC